MTRTSVLGAHLCLMESHNTGRAGREASPRSSPEPLKILAAGAVGQELAHHVFEQSPMPTYSVSGRTACLEICYRRMQEIIWCFCGILAVKGLPRVQQISSTGHGIFARALGPANPTEQYRCANDTGVEKTTKQS